MDGIGSSLPSMPEPASPLSMKQPPESLAGRKGRGDVSGDPALLMDQAAAHLAATLQDTVLQKMTGHAHSNHSHERLKDLTSRVLNGDQDKSAKLCAPETPVLKAAEALATSATHQRRCPAHSDPELKLQITQMVPQPRFEPCEGVLSGGDAAQEVKKRKGRARKAKPPSKPGSPATGAIANPVPPGCMQIPQLAVPEVQVVPDQKEVQAVPDQKEVQEVPDQKEVQEVPDQKEVQEVPDQKGVQGVPDQKEVQGNQDQKEVRGNQDQKEVQGNQDQKEVQGNQDQKKVQGILDEKEVQGILEVHRVKAVQEVKEHSPQVRFCVGDVVWTKVSGYPWWPCMVSTDPEIEQHVKPKRRGIGPPGLLYHVQYFGDCPERGYIFEKSMVLFTGEAGQYEELSQANKQPASRLIRKRVTLGTALVPRKFQAQWSMGITQAQEAVNMPLDERMDKFTYVYGDDGPHLNPHVVEKLKPAEHEGTEQGVESRLIPLPAVQVTVALQSTSAGKKPPVACAKKKVGKRRNQGEPTRSLATKKPESPTCAKESLVPEPDAQDFNTALCSETQSEVGETQQTKSKANQTGHSKTWKTDKIKSLSATASTSEPRKKNTLKKLSPKDGSSESAQSTLSVKKGRKKKGRDEETMVTAKRKTSCKRPLTETTADQTDQQPKRKLKTSKGAEKLKALAPETTPNKTQRRRKETEKDVKQVKKRQKVSLSGDPSPEDQRHGRKRKREVCEQQPSSSKTKKRRSSLCHESEGSGSEERPGSPSDSLDEAKKGERNNGTRKEFVCQVCEQPGEDLLACEGQCYGMFHLSCLGLSLKPEDKLLCQECSTGVHSCFSCKKPAGELRRCYVPNCGKFYHEACARLSTLTVFDNRGFRCPLHTCLSCHLSCRTNGKATKGKMMRCLRCPTAYHVGDVCVAAGSHMVTNTSVVCTNHFHAKKGYSHHSHLNVSWCFVCSKGGQLLCCESCPAAFHPDCLNITMPDGSWFCNDCRAGKKPKYHDIIWVKLGTYRWWPAEIRHPRNVPTNIQHLRHQIGEFPVFFFGSRDFFWTHQGRVFPYMEGDRGSKHQTTGIGKVFKNALLEAEARFKEMKMKREAKEAQENNKKPPPYKFIKVNKPCGKVQVYTADISEIPKCNCTPSDERPCGFESECLNRMLLYECHPQVCPSGGHCCNQDFTKRLYPDTKIIKTAGKGWGLICLRDIKKGEFVNEYIGELIDEEECRARIRYAQENNITHFYMLTIDKDRIIDAGPKGNYSRFMNHSCQPNCETQKWTVNGDTRVGLFAVCDIPAGTELTFNYNLDCLGNEKTVCHCDAPNCSGFLGDRPKTSSAASSEIKAKKTKRRKRRSEGKKSEDECFRCGDGGELVLCDKKSCTKAYHVSCLHLAKRPFGRWDCPWHHCDVCGKNSEAFCQLCPNSFCRLHQEGALEAHPSTGQLQCLEHEEQERPMEPPQTNPRPTKASRKKAEA